MLAQVVENFFKARPDVDFCCHTHPHWATLFSATREKLKAYTNEGAWFTIPPAHYLTTSDLIDSPELGRDLAKSLGKGEAVFLRNHGMACIGKTVKDLTLCAVFLERACRAQLELAMTGLKHSAPEKTEIDKKRKTIYPQRAVDNFWDYYNRRLDRVEGTDQTDPAHLTGVRRGGA